MNDVGPAKSTKLRAAREANRRDHNIIVESKRRNERKDHAKKKTEVTSSGSQQLELPMIDVT